MTQREPTAAQALFGHLPSAYRVEQPRRPAAPSIADAMYGHLRPAPPQVPRPTRQPRLTREQAWDWSDVDPETAWLFGFVRKEGRR